MTDLPFSPAPPSTHPSLRRTKPGLLPLTALLVAALLGSLLLPAPARAEDSSTTALWTLIKQWLDSAPRVAPAQWSDGSVALSWQSDRLTATWRGTLTAGAAGAVELPVLAGGGAVSEVKIAGTAADWRASGGVVLLRLAADAPRRAEIEVTAQWPLSRRASQAVVVPLPDWSRGTLQQSPDDLEVIGADADGSLPHATRALLVRTQDSLAPRIRSARYTLQLAAGAATVDLRVEVEGRGALGAVALAPAELALVDVAVDGRPVAPLPAQSDGDDEACQGKHCVEVAGKGMQVITARLQVKSEGDLEDLQVELGRVAAPMTAPFAPPLNAALPISSTPSRSHAWLLT